MLVIGASVSYFTQRMAPHILIVPTRPLHRHGISTTAEPIVIPLGKKDVFETLSLCISLVMYTFVIISCCSYGSIYGRTSSNNMSDSSVSDTHSGGTARTVSQQTSPSHGTHSSSQSRQDNSITIFTALFDYVAQGEDELSLQRGETVEVIYFQMVSHNYLIIA